MLTKNEKSKLLQEKAISLRYDVLNMMKNPPANGRVSSSFSCAEILTTLFYSGELRFNPENPEWEDRDRILLSKGQASPIFYAILADLGYIPQSYISTMCQKGGKLGSLIQAGIPGSEINSASLGHGLGIGVGMALAGKLDMKTYSVFVVLGDGECYEGSVWESAMLAAHHNLNNLIVIVDQNHMCCTDFIEDCVAQDSLECKFESFGFDTLSVNGHSIDKLMDSIQDFRSRKRNKPLAIIADTVKASGLKTVEATYLCHEYCPRADQVEDAIKELDAWVQAGGTNSDNT